MGGNMALESYEFDSPAHWASCLINGDLTGLDYSGPAAVAEYEAWCATHADEQRDVVSCDGEPWIGRFNGPQTELLTYQALRRTEG